MMKNRKLFYVILGVSILAIIGVGLLMYMGRASIEDVKARYESSLMNIPGVVGVGIGECDKVPCIKVYLEKETLESKSIPKQLEGFKVDVEVAGPIEALGQVKIQADMDTYTPLTSSTVGIGLTPIYTLGRSPETVKFHWHTNYGHFVSWGSPDFKVNELESEVINSGEEIYWSYGANEMDVEKPPVQISLRIEDAQSGQLLAESILEIDWEDRYIAKVKK
jgi:hypothetical protein